MKLLKFIAFFTILLTFNSHYGQFTDQINSNRPGKSAGAFSVGKNIYQVETGIYGIRESHQVLDYKASGFGLDLSARAGLLKEQLEFTLDIQFQLDNYTSVVKDISRIGIKQSTFGAKYLFYDPHKGKEDKPNIYSWKANHKTKWKKLIPAISGYVGVNYVMKNDFSIPNESVASPKIMVIAQNQFGARWVLVTNLVADKITSIASNFGYIITITRGLNDKWSVFFENKAIKGKYYSDGILTLGATHLLKNNLQIDASISKNIKDTPSLFYGGIGCSWRFDKKHKDIKMENGKEVKEEKKKKNTSGIKTEEELKDAMENAEKKKDKNNSDIDAVKPADVIKKKRLDDIEEEKPETTPTPEVTPKPLETPSTP